jgi:hypothetical protein
VTSSPIVFLKFKESSLAADGNVATSKSAATSLSKIAGSKSVNCIFKIQRIWFGGRRQRCNVEIGRNLIVKNCRRQKLQAANLSIVFLKFKDSGLAADGNVATWRSAATHLFE